MKTVSEKTNEELKAEIKEQVAKEYKEKAENIRLSYLRAEVEVEYLWDSQDPQKKHRDNLNRWLNEWANRNYQTYLRMIKDNDLPSILVQCQHSPDLYEKQDEYWSSYGYRSKTNAKDRKTDALAIGIVAGCIALLVGIIIWLV